MENTLASNLNSLLFGQGHAIDAIVPFVEMHRAQLAPEGRPVGVFLLLGPSGTGKTKTAEALAQILHGSEKNVLRVDCGEFQMEHEVAKLIGAPPGYLGHRETHPLLTQQKVNCVTSEHSNLSIVLFDEIEKAATSLHRLLLGVLDKASLRLGDNTTVNFERTLIFLTSNLGAREMLGYLKPAFGFQNRDERSVVETREKLQAIGLSAVRKKFSPEFVNRIDEVITYRPLDTDTNNRIIDTEVNRLQAHIVSRLGVRAFTIKVSPEARKHLVAIGVTEDQGARNLKRCVLRAVVRPLVARLVKEEIQPDSTVLIHHKPFAAELSFTVQKPEPVEKAA
jgi:ATP-dependent Clp protease ATP-binding subunit ClpA